MSRMISTSNSFLQNRVVLWLLRIAVGLVFILASISKLDQPEEFLDIIMAYSIVPWSPAIIMAVWLPWIELIVGFVFLLGVWVRASALLLSALTIVFIVALTSALIRGLDFACGCFSVSDITQTRSWTSLWQESLVLLGCIWLWAAHWPDAHASIGDE